MVNVRGLAGVWEGGEWTSVGLRRYIWGTAFMYSGEDSRMEPVDRGAFGVSDSRTGVPAWSLRSPHGEREA